MPKLNPKYSGQVHHIWPEGESACIWMQAGLIAFKLCDRAFECEQCPFDHLMKGGSTGSQAEGSAVIVPASFRHNSPAEQAKNTLQQSLYYDPDAWYGAGFWYVRQKDERLAEIGLNDIGLTFLPTVREVILPRPGTVLSIKQTAMWLIVSEGTLGLAPPCDGRVQRNNPALLGALLQKPEEQRETWFSEIEVSSFRSAHKDLCKGARAAEYLQTQYREIVQTLQDALENTRKNQSISSSNRDLRPDYLEEMLGRKRYFHLVAQFYRR